MSTFLELCQKVAAESGTMTGGVSSISTVVGQTGRASWIVRWTAQAYKDVQTHRPSWKWMQGEFEAPLVIGQQRYTAADLSITRLKSFVIDNCRKRLFIYDTTKGVEDEGALRFVEWDIFQQHYLVGASRTQIDRPTACTIDDQGLLVFFAKPDKAYVIHGSYRKSPQALVADDDVPDMPEAYHDIIMWKALMLLGTYDEALNQYPLWRAEYQRLLSELEHDQLPQIRLAGALA